MTDTLVWDGPNSLDEFRRELADRKTRTANGEAYVYTITDGDTDAPIGSASIRADANRFRGIIGLWIGAPFQGYGYGSLTIRRLVELSFDQLGLTKIDANVFVGNQASRRIFEKTGSC